MPKVIKYQLGALKSVTRIDGTEYDDWHATCPGGQGLILLAESIRKAPGKRFITFMYSHDLNIPFLFWRELKTSTGEVIKDDDNELVLQTTRSIYTFSYSHSIVEWFGELLMEVGEHIKENTLRREEVRAKGKALAEKIGNAERQAWNEKLN